VNDVRRTAELLPHSTGSTQGAQAVGGRGARSGRHGPL